MPVVVAGDLTNLRKEHHKSDVRLSFLVPPILWEARIDDATIVKGETSIDFDTGTGSFFSIIAHTQELWVGSSLNSDDVGRMRIKSISSGDGGVTGTVVVAGHAYPLNDNQYLTFKHDYPLKPRRSFIDRIDPDTEIWYMDDDIAYTDQNDTQRPTVIAGDHRAGFLNPTLVLNVDASNSYPQDSGDSISSYGLTVASTAGTPTVNFSTVTGLGDITFSAAGYYWARYTVLASNGKSQQSLRLYIVHDPDRSAGNYPFIDCEQVTLENEWENGGWMAAVRADDKATLAEIPDHTLCIIWGESYFDGTESQITFLPDNSTTLFAGYVRGDSDAQDWSNGVGEVDLTLSTIEGVLRQMFTFSTSLNATQGGPSKWFHGKADQKPIDIIHNFWRWRTTLYDICDVLWETDNTLLRAFQGMDEGNPYDSANIFLYEEGIRTRVMCDQGGRIHIVPDQQLLIDSQRASLTTIFELSNLPQIADYGGQMVIPRKPEFDVPFVTANGVTWDGSFDAEGKPVGVDICSIAPGGKPLWRGPSPTDKPKQTVTDQNHLNQIAGRYEAKLNNPIQEFRIELHGNYVGVFDCAYGEQYEADLQASQNPRGLSWSNKPLYLRHTMAVYEGLTGFWNVNCSFEPEHSTDDGVTTNCPSFPALGGDIPDIPTDDLIPGALMTGASVNYKLALTDLWTQLTTENVEDLIEDPFWRVRKSSVAPEDAIVIRCGTGYIKRSTDGGQTWSTVTPTTNPPNDAGDSPAPTVGNVTFNELDGSISTQSEFVALVTWQNAASQWRTWLYYTDDDFATNGTWTSIGGGTGDDLGNWKTSSSVDDNYIQSGWAEKGFVHSACRITDDKVVVVFKDISNPYTYAGFARVITIQSDGSLVVGARQGPYNYEANGDKNEIQGAKIWSWDSTHFILIAHELDYAFGDPSGEWALTARLCSVSGNNITFGSPIYLADDADFYPADWNFVKMPGLSNYGIITYSDWWISPSAQDTGFVTVVQATGTVTLSQGSNYTFETRGGAGGAGVDMAGPMMHTTNNGVIYYNTSKDYDGNGTWQIYYRPITVTGYSISVGSRVHTGDGAFAVKVAFLTDTKGVLLAEDSAGLRTRTYSRSGSTYTFESTLKYPTSDTSAPAWGFDIAAISSSQWAVFWDTGANWGIYARVASLTSEYNHAYGTVAFLDESSDPPDYWDLWRMSGAVASSKWLFGSFEETFGDNWLRASVVGLPVGYETKGLGVSIGRGAGARAWITIWDSADGLSLVDMAIPAMTETNRFILGAATEAEMNAKTWIAYPRGVYGVDNACLVFGRMDAPDGLASPEHVISTVDAGSSFQSIENGWSVDHCGALVYGPGGYMYAIRNRPNQAKFYRDEGDNNLQLKITLSFSAPVAPHGMFIDFLFQDAFIASRLADSVMVVKLATPYFTEADLTFNHDNTAGVEAIIRL